MYIQGHHKNKNMTYLGETSTNVAERVNNTFRRKTILHTLPTPERLA